MCSAFKSLGIFVKLPCVFSGSLVMAALYSIPSCKMDLWCM